MRGPLYRFPKAFWGVRGTMPSTPQHKNFPLPYLSISISISVSILIQQHPSSPHHPNPQISNNHIPAFPSRRNVHRHVRVPCRLGRALMGNRRIQVHETDLTVQPRGKTCCGPPLPPSHSSPLSRPIMSIPSIRRRRRPIMCRPTQR